MVARPAVEHTRATREVTRDPNRSGSLAPTLRIPITTTEYTTNTIAEPVIPSCRTYRGTNDPKAEKPHTLANTTNPGSTAAGRYRRKRSAEPAPWPSPWSETRVSG